MTLKKTFSNQPFAFCQGSYMPIIVILIANLIFEFAMSGSEAVMLAQNREFCLLLLQSSILESLRQAFHSNTV